MFKINKFKLFRTREANCSFMFKRIVKGDVNIDIEQGRKTGRNVAKKKGMIDFDCKMLSFAFSSGPVRDQLAKCPELPWIS